METRAPFIVIGAFVLAAVAAVFGFVYWLNNTGGLGKRDVYQVQFEGSVSGLLVGAAVLFNGIKVGEVTGLTLVPEQPRRVRATIAVAQNTPVHTDTKVGLEFQGLTGVPVVALEGGKETDPEQRAGLLVAEAGAGQSMTQAARDALRHVDAVLTENAAPLRNTIANLETFSEGLAKNTPRLDGIIAGVERMTGGGGAAGRKAIYDLPAADGFKAPHKELKGPLVIPEPAAIVLFDTQRFLFAPGKELDGFNDAQWGDTVPKLLQAKLIQSFENFDIAHPPLRDAPDAAFQLLIELRRFQISGENDASAEIAFSAKLVDRAGHIVASRLFSSASPLRGRDPLGAVSAFGAAFATTATDLVVWTADAM